MYTAVLWDKKTPINGCPAEVFIDSNPLWRDGIVMLLMKGEQVVRIENAAVVNSKAEKQLYSDNDSEMVKVQKTLDYINAAHSQISTSEMLSLLIEAQADQIGGAL